MRPHEESGNQEITTRQASHLDLTGEKGGNKGGEREYFHVLLSFLVPRGLATARSVYRLSQRCQCKVVLESVLPV